MTNLLIRIKWTPLANNEYRRMHFSRLIFGKDKFLKFKKKFDAKKWCLTLKLCLPGPVIVALTSVTSASLRCTLMPSGGSCSRSDISFKSFLITSGAKFSLLQLAILFMIKPEIEFLTHTQIEWDSMKIQACNSNVGRQIFKQGYKVP